MALGTSRSVALQGVDGVVIDVEADVSSGLPATRIIGLADTAVAQAEHRVRVAMGNSGLQYPDTRLTVNLAPTDLPKHGAMHDLAIAAAVLAAQGALSRRGARETVVLGELGLDGRVLPVPGVLPALLAARAGGRTRAVVPAANLAEARLVSGVDVAGVHDLAELIGRLGGDLGGVRRPPRDRGAPGGVLDPGGGTADVDPRVGWHEVPPDLATVRGQPEAVEALVVAAAGRHHLLLEGSPGAGKSLLAQTLPGILPPLDRDRALEATAVRSITSPGGVRGLVDRPPFEAPHHSLTMAALIGGGTGLRPGLVSLSAHGVLFLDEAPEFRSRVLDALRQCLETGTITLHRGGRQARLPADFQLVAAMNPCPCGRALELDGSCSCTPSQRMRYTARLSGPMLDRIDLRVTVGRVRARDVLAADRAELDSARALRRVVAARRRAVDRLAPHGLDVNGRVPGAVLRGALRLGPATTATLDRALDHGLLSLRGYDRVLRAAWTLADLDEVDRPHAEHLARALRWRGVEAIA